MRSATHLALILLVGACGQEQTPETTYGSLDDVNGYLKEVSPFIQEIGKIHAEFEEGLGSATDDEGRRRGTGRNLAEAAAVVQKPLRRLLGEFEKIDPPPLLAPFHRDTKRLILLRLEAYETTSKGWQTQQSDGDFEPIYRQAEVKMAESNSMIQRLNDEMLKINTAVQRAAEAPAQSPS